MATRSGSHYWFRAKRSGWGWGLPARWQGWAVLAGYGLVMTAAGVLGTTVHSSLGQGLALLVVIVASIAFVLVCAVTGEPPQWRWGSRR